MSLLYRCYCLSKEMERPRFRAESCSLVELAFVREADDCLLNDGVCRSVGGSDLLQIALSAHSCPTLVDGEERWRGVLCSTGSSHFDAPPLRRKLRFSLDTKKFCNFSTHWSVAKTCRCGFRGQPVDGVSASSDWRAGLRGWAIRTAR